MEDDDRSDAEVISLGDDTSETNNDGASAEALARQETKAVSWLRGTVLVVLVIASVLVSSSVYVSTSRTEVKQFHDAFDDAANKMLESFQQAVQRKLRAIDSLALDIGSYSRSLNSKWPNVTLPEYGMRGASTRSLAQTASIMLLPIVTESEKPGWESYAIENQQWASEELRRREKLPPNTDAVKQTRKLKDHSNDSDLIPKHIHNLEGAVNSTGPFAPIWQTSPMSRDMVSWINFDLFSMEHFSGGLNAVKKKSCAILEQVSNFINGSEKLDIQLLLHASIGEDPSYKGEPVSPLFYPVFNERNTSNSRVVAILSTLFYWRLFFSDVLQSRVNDIVCVVKNECGQAFTYRIKGEKTSYIGQGNLHDSKFDYLGKKTGLTGGLDADFKQYHAVELDRDYCRYSLLVYPSHSMHEIYITNRPLMYTTVVALIFLFASLIFVLYDFLVERRQKVVMNRALQSSAIVSSLFPETVRDRLFRGGDVDEVGHDSMLLSDHAALTDDPLTTMVVEPAKQRLKSFLADDVDGQGDGAKAKPIADLFPNCTVIFADISGFTAWSSLRSAGQVFTLLESVYQAFDKIARKRDVFKVETVGDSYVAVTGLPDPQEDHAVIMARFARDCRQRMNEVTRKLELTLGPDTGDLCMRFGLHSGPVTAGVLRGERSRFQLFGDTVNTAARMESTGERDRIQCSQATAELLRLSGKGHWLRARETLVHAKGKGELQTYWIEVVSQPTNLPDRRGSVHSDDSGTSQHNDELAQENGTGNSPGRSALWGINEEIPDILTQQRSKHQRLIDYNVDLLCQHLKHIVARRKVLAMAGRRCSQGGLPPRLHELSTVTSTVLDEVVEIIRLPNFNPRAFKDHVDPETIELGPKVVSQLKRYVTITASMYRRNPFHNFEHASHVTMSVNKLLQRVVTPDLSFRRQSLPSNNRAASQAIASDLHQYTFGITSDPLTQFAVVFSALIHDVDHWGVSNAQLIKEGAPMTEKYNNKSIAEQNSVDLAWDLLMDPEEYGDLQEVIFPTDAEYKRFRQLVVNSVMATDIFDKELGELRRKRWAKAFEEKTDEKQDVDDRDRKATIVIEHIMQASDVAHTMQHWHVYQKWNRRLFDELYTAWKAKRMDLDPSTFWFQSEMKFFDGYIIPLAKKLKDCGVFGVASDECLNYALENRKEWEAKGQTIIQELVSNYHQREKEEEQAAEQAAAAKKKRPRFSRRRSLITTGG